MKNKTRNLVLCAVAAVPCVLAACSGAAIAPPNLPAPEYEAPRAASPAVAASSAPRAKQAPDPTDVPIDDGLPAAPASARPASPAGSSSSKK